MEVEMILLNLTDEILENTKKEGWEVVEVEMTPTQVVEEVPEEADLIQPVVEMQPTQGYLLRYCRNVRPTWVKFDSKDTKESEFVFEVLSTKSKKRT